MTRPDGTRRKQFSSCDACRKSRIRCVRLEGSRTVPARRCAHCAKRGLDCTYDWLQSAQIANHSKRKSHLQTETSALRQFTIDAQESQHGDCADESWDASQPVPTFDLTLHEHDLHLTLWRLFSSILEPIFAIWLSADCCPYGDTNKVTLNRLCKH